MAGRKPKETPVVMRLKIPEGPINYSLLAKEVKISPKSKVSIFKPGYGISFEVPCVEVLIGIGKDHTAHLVMDMEAWAEFKKGTPITIDTLKNFREGLK
jgi:hypothetical protein